MTPSDFTGPYVPLNTPWKAIEGYFFRVKHFTPLSTVQGGKVVSSSMTMPHGLLDTEALDGQEVRIVVAHSKDFLALRHVFEERGVADNEEVVIAHVPYYQTLRFLNRMMPTFHIYIFQKGYFESMGAEVISGPPASIAAWIHGQPR